MRNTKKVTLIKGRVLRVTRLDACGRPVYGDDAKVTSKGFISVGVTANTTDSDAILVTNANGETIASEASVKSFSGYSVEISFAEVDPELFAMVTGQNVVLDAFGNPAGFDNDTAITLTGSGFALEVWAGAPTGDVCSTDGAQGSFGYVLFPFLQGGVLGDFSIENAAITFTITGPTTKDGNSWGVGPYKVMLNALGQPAVMAQPLTTTTAMRILLVDVLPPEVETGSRPLLDPSDAAISSVTATTTTGSSVVTIAVVPDPAADQGVEYDFGDGTWDFVLGGDTTHTYETAGTYTVSASTNGTFVTTTVTVPGA